MTHLTYVAMGNIVRKGEIACNKQFLLFSQCFLPYMALIFHFKNILKCRLRICFTIQGPMWLNGKVFDLSSRGPEFEPHWILWNFSWECPWARHFSAQPSSGETQERHE